ncbi:probable aquaporin NIP-type [Diospyros lotus]|uniref:probable aquaporin NIP-type n=1 Tax=Diospyros lotus TaxID=55363 RepID=UPI002258D4A7|nr:probable aquaporin NIP-type [Diospyros lotus]
METKADGTHGEISRLEEGDAGVPSGQESKSRFGFCTSTSVITMTQKVVAEVIGTFFVIFSGCGAVVVNKLYGGKITHPGVSATWGLTVMVMVYSVGHISGGHFNPAVTICFAAFRQFPLWEVPFYIVAQLMGSIIASGTLALMFSVTHEAFFGTVPAGSDAQSFVIEIVISFLLMFVISGVSTENTAVGDLAGVAIGMTIMLNVLVAGPVSGASMNPARSIGPAIVKSVYKGLWVYILGPVIGTLAGRFAYNLIKLTDTPMRELTKSFSKV